jgi:hypothetical protein
MDCFSFYVINLKNSCDLYKWISRVDAYQKIVLYEYYIQSPLVSKFNLGILFIRE